MSNELQITIEELEKKFELKNPDEINVTFDEYINRAKALIESRSFPNSNMHKVDEFASNPVAFFQKYRNELKIPNSKISFSKSFAALVAPSLEGKTQTAFTMRNALPLYFVVAATKLGEGNIQRIYKPFVDHGVSLQGFAYADLRRLRKSCPENEIAPNAESLLNNKITGFFVLGFLKEIMDQAVEAKRNGTSESFDWMYFYARRLKTFECHPVKIDDFIAHLEKLNELHQKFCVFLDEFLASEWAVYVRNLIRAVGMVCVVANTNINIANLVSKGSDYSRDDGISDNCWCLAFRRLDNVSEEVIQIQPYLEAIKARCGQNSQFSAAMFDTLFNDWFYKSRPGIADWALKALVRMVEKLSKGEFIAEHQNQEVVSDSDVLTIGSILQFLATEPAAELANRKRRMVSRLNGQVAKLGLFTDAAYFDSSIPANMIFESEAFFKFIQFLENHLYYLVNPTGSELDFFLLFKPEDDDHEYLRFALENPTSLQYTEWDVQLTAFRNDELFTFLSCMFVKLDRSPNFILYHANKQHMISNKSISGLRNINAIKLSGNHLEMAAAMTCADASHHTAALKPVYSLHGQDGWTWIKNIIANCSLSQTFRSLQCVSERGGFDIQSWLEKSCIPYLYGINHPNEMMDRLSNTPGSGVFAKNYISTKDSDSIDGRFQFSQAGVMAECVIECKNYKEPADASTLNTLINKAITARKYEAATSSEEKLPALPKLFLIFTNDLSEPNMVSSMSKTCAANKINLFRITLHLEGDEERRKSIVDKDGYMGSTFLTLKPYHPGWQIYENPQTVGIIFQMNCLD